MNTTDLFMEEYFSGKKLYGDDFTYEQIQAWYADEKEGYANLVAEFEWAESHGAYGYHELNKLHGFRYLPKNKVFERALGLGSALGDEFLPVISQIKSISILEPSDNLVSDQLQGVALQYKKPSVEGKIDYPDNHFQLETCFGTLHHIPNVSFVLSELHRVLAPGGYLLIREPVHSMGDWRFPRYGLTKRERGIPVDLLRTWIRELGFDVVHESFCFAMTFFLERKIGRFLKKPLHEYKWYIYMDKVLSAITAFNLKYHARNPLQRIAPSSVFYVLCKR